ncbi:MAG: alpha-hydroxy-acid oxidizing protein [Oscillospiraceae bacterium]|nr:alpha-hydroxy-acid oxidizing protein [Oscillospiraceae bacterium]
MNYNEILEKARGLVGEVCKACPVCNGRACGNKMPGPGSKLPDNVAARNYDKWQEIFVNMDTLCPGAPVDTSFELFGKSFSAPIFVAPLGAVQMHYGKLHDDISYNGILVPAAVNYGICALTGDGVNAEVMKNAVKNMKAVGGMGIPTIKPWANEVILEKLDILNEAGVFAAAMDVDGAGLPFLKEEANADAGPKSVEQLREIVEHADMPFIVKGIMTPAGARKAIEAGAAGIVVSNHGGRVQGCTPSTAEVLPSIVKAVNGECRVFVDGGIRSGVDVYKALALGADAVLIGRPLVPFIYAAGEEGFRVYMDRLVGELRDTMTMCGTPTLKDISEDNIFMAR